MTTNIEGLESRDDKAWDLQWQGWKPSCVCTACYILDGAGNVLLIQRKKKGFGNGKVCAPGGHREEGETTDQCCIRETMEEVGLLLEDPIHVGTLNFKIPGNDMEGHIYVATKYSGTPKETDEAQPFWCPVDALPFDRMFDDDRVWLPYALRKIPFVLDAVCNEDGDMQSYRFMLCNEGEAIDGHPSSGNPNGFASMANDTLKTLS